MYSEENATKQGRLAFGHSQARVLTVVKHHLRVVHAGLRKNVGAELCMICTLIEIRLNPTRS